MLKSRPPCLDSTAVCSLLKTLYPFRNVEKSSIKELPGYEDRNFYFRGCLEEAKSQSVHDGETSLLSSSPACLRDAVNEEFILKVSHITNSCELLEGVNEAMDHLRYKGFNCSCAILNRCGNKILKMSENQLIRGYPDTRTGRGAQYPLRVLTYIPGETLEAVPMSSKLAYEIGKLAGDIDKALLDFSHPVLNCRTFSCPIWDLGNFMQIKPLSLTLKLNYLQRNILESTLSNFEKFVQPLLPTFSMGILHSDITVQNIVHTSDGFGIIDFGDCVRSCHLFELAVAIHGFISRKDIKDMDEMVRLTAPLVAGYFRAFPLSNEELDCLYYAVLARMCVAAVATEMNARVDPNHSYLVDLVQQSWRGAEEFFRHSKEDLDQLWKDALEK